VKKVQWVDTISVLCESSKRSCILRIFCRNSEAI